MNDVVYLGVVVVAEVVVLVPAALIQRRAVPQVTLQGGRG